MLDPLDDSCTRAAAYVTSTSTTTSVKEVPCRSPDRPVGCTTSCSWRKDKRRSRPRRRWGAGFTHASALSVFCACQPFTDDVHPQSIGHSLARPYAFLHHIFSCDGSHTSHREGTDVYVSMYTLPDQYYLRSLIPSCVHCLSITASTSQMSIRAGQRHLHFMRVRILSAVAPSAIRRKLG
jgi:hypothetical protein